MGVSLTLYFPIRSEIRFDQPLFAADRLHLPLDDGARPTIETWGVLPLYGGLQYVTEEEGLTETRHDAYGDPLTYLPAGVIHAGPYPLAGVSPWTLAVFAFLFHLPPEQLVVLYWD